MSKFQRNTSNRTRNNARFAQGDFIKRYHYVLKQIRLSLNGLPRQLRKQVEIEVCYLQNTIDSHVNVYYNKAQYIKHVEPLIVTLKELRVDVEKINTNLR